MAATKPTVLIVAAVVLIGCAGQRSDAATFAEQQAALDATSRCLATIDSELKSALGKPPSFASVEGAVEWTRLHLPPEFRQAFENAGVAFRHASAGKALADEAINRAKFQQRLYSLTATELQRYSLCQDRNAWIGVPDKVANLLNLTLRLSEEPMFSHFSELRLDDSYYIEQAFVMMLTLDATGQPWDKQWLARDP